MPHAPTISIAIPTRGRPDYLAVTLASVGPQARGAEVLVVSDGIDEATAAAAERHGARLVPLPASSGANAARNAAIAASTGELIVFLDDDIEAPAGWFDALLAGVRRRPEQDVFGGPIRARLEGGGPRACGREPAPITTLDFGDSDRDVPFVWSANMAVRRAAFDRLGVFDESIFGRGEEEEWQERYLAGGGRIGYIAGAGVDHRRAAEDATIRRLARADYQLGRTALRNDIRKGDYVRLRLELRTLAGCCWHVVRRRCPLGLVRVAHSAGRLREAVAELRHPGAAVPAEDFLSGTSGGVWGISRTSRAAVMDALDDVRAAARLQPWRLRRASHRLARRRVLVLALERTDAANLLAQARGELLRSRHEVEFVGAPVGDRGKFENLNALLENNRLAGRDWLLVVDDDVALPRYFLDQFLFLAERFDLRLAQPAHRHRSHAAWAVTRRHGGSAVRETSFVEIGPVTAFHASVFEALLPFPALKAGWGLDLHWGAVARSQGWRIGVVDATPVRHGLRRVASSYDASAAMEEARAFLAERPYVRASDALRSVRVHRSW